MLNEKIKDILSVKNLSPSRFADEIGVQRSSISHILSGRNKPSLDIIQKINRRFPELGTNWFMEESSVVSEEVISPTPLSGQQNEPSLTRSSKIPGTIANPNPNPNPNPPHQESVTGKEIEKILIFYKDKTFSEYRPAQ